MGPFTCYGRKANQWRQLVPPLQHSTSNLRRVVASVDLFRYLIATFAKTQSFEQFLLRVYMRVGFEGKASHR